MAPRVFKRFFYDLTYWPSFWSGMIHIQSWLSLIKIGPKLWPLECSQGFSMVWPTDLVFWPGMIHIWSWPSLMKIGQKLWLLECSQGFSMICPSGLVFDQRSPIFKLDWDIVKMIILSKFWWRLDQKLWPLECSHGFSMIWPTDLVSDPTSPIFELDWDIVKMIILSKFDEDWTKTLASRVFTRFFPWFDLLT